MESLSSVRTIMAIVQDILAAVEAASQNKSRCKKLAERVRCIKDILEAAAVDDDDDDADAATRRPLKRLRNALGRALEAVRQCQRSSSFLGSVVAVAAGVVFAGGRSTMAESLDDVEREIDRCVIDLTLANSLRIAARQQQHKDVDVAADHSISEKDAAEKYKGSAESVLPDNTTATAAIGIPVCTGVVDEQRHEMVPAAPSPSYGYYDSYYWRNHGYGDGDDASNAALYRIQYSSYPSMFSDDDPNSCSVM